MVSKTLLSPYRSGYVLELLLDQLFWLRMVKMVQIQSQRLRFYLVVIKRAELLLLVLFGHGIDLVLRDAVLQLQPLMLLLHHADILVSAEVVILLQKDCIVFILIEVENRLKVFLIKVLLLELSKDQISLFRFSEPCQEYLEVVLDLLN